jgi:hypothetical protein
MAVASSGEIRSTFIRIELVQPFALQKRSGRYVVEGEAEIGEDEDAAFRLRKSGQHLADGAVGTVVEVPEINSLA